MTRDPVCGMEVDEKKAPAKATYEGKQYAFCGEGCKEKFEQDPERYLAESPVGSSSRRRM